MTTTFVIARFKEDIEWLTQLPENSIIYLYNKGNEIDTSKLPKNVKLKNIANYGRESNTYLHYMINDFIPNESDFTIFTQADPFEHSPDFINLVSNTEKWRDIQPLSLLWIAEKNIPPLQILEDARGDWLENYAVRAEHFSLRTWAPLSFFDDGAWGIGKTYRQKHLLPTGTNIAAHFFDMVGLQKLKEQALNAEFGVFSYGAIYGVRSDLVRKFIYETDPRTFDRLNLLSRADPNYGYIYERIWLHFFGEPFLKFDAVKNKDAIDLTKNIVDIFDYTEFRDNAFYALHKNDPNEALKILKNAISIRPGNPEILCDISTVFFQQGNHSEAEIYSKNSILNSTNLSSSLFILAMSLSANGKINEAINIFEIISKGIKEKLFYIDQKDIADIALNEHKRLASILNNKLTQ